jgi:hypothetical protein
VRSLHEFQRRWIALFQAVGARDARAMAALAAALLENATHLGANAREYLLMAGMSGALASGRPDQAMALWHAQAPLLRDAVAQPVFRLLRCQAQRGEPCVAAFRPYARD